MARDTAPNRISEKPLSRRVLVEIDRDMTAKTSKVVWQHEMPVIEAVFGEGRVRMLDPSVLDEGYNPKSSPALMPYNKKEDQTQRPSETQGIGFVFIGDPKAEHARLAMVYGKLAEENILAVEKVYGRFQGGTFERAVGRAELTDLPDAQLRSLIEAYGLAPSGAHKDMTDAEKTAASQARTAFVNASRETLLKIAADGGVEIA